MVAQRTTGRLSNQPNQTLKGFHNSAVCRTPSAFFENPPPNPGCAARPGALLLKSFGLSCSPQKSKTLRSKLWVKTRVPRRASLTEEASIACSRYLRLCVQTFASSPRQLLETCIRSWQIGPMVAGVGSSYLDAFFVPVQFGSHVRTAVAQR